MPDTRTALIRCEAVGFQIHKARLVSDLTFDVQEGETVTLLGRSGSGKTTTLRLLNRMLKPTVGQVWVKGRTTEEWDPIHLRRQMGYVIQDVGLFPHFSVERNIGLVPRLEGWDESRVRQRIAELIERVGLPSAVARRYPDELSGGQRQRVGVARALAADPPVLLMDEPFGALDPITRRELQAEFKTMQSSLRKTIVFVTHDVREAMLLGDRIGVMEKGRLVWLGTESEFAASGDPCVAAFREEP